MRYAAGADGDAERLAGAAWAPFDLKRGRRYLLPLLLGALALLLLLGRAGDGMTAQERRLAVTLSSVQGAGQVRVTLYYAEDTGGFGGGGKRVTGALAVAAGAGDIGVRLRLTEALETLLGLPTGSVLVLKMGEQ